MELTCQYCGGKVYKHGFSNTREHYQRYRCSQCKKYLPRDSPIYPATFRHKMVEKSEDIGSLTRKMDWHKLYVEVFGGRD